MHFSRVLVEYGKNNFFDSRPPQEPKWNEIFYDHYVSSSPIRAATDLRTEEEKKGCRIHNSYHICLANNEENDEQENEVSLQ